MEENKTSDLVPLSETEGTKKMPLRKICIKVYLNEQEFTEWIKMAEEAGVRPRGLKPFRQKNHGFFFERIANTKGIVKFLKKVVVPYWKKGDKARKEELLQAKAVFEKYGKKVD